MNEIVAGLIASISTIACTKIIDIFQLDRTYKNDRKKYFFEKKLVAGEMIFAEWQGFQSLMSELATLYKACANGDCTLEVFNEMNQRLSSKLIELESSSSKIVKTSSIYFNIPIQKSEENISYSNFLKLLSEIRINENAAIEAYKNNDLNKAQQYFDIFIKGLGNLSKMFAEAQSFYIDKLSIIQNDLNQYK